MLGYADAEKAIFLAALEQSTAREREAYLRSACSDDPELLKRVKVLLSVHEQSRGPLDAPSPGVGIAPTVHRPIAERPGTMIGPYKLLEQIGEGGFGVVFMAEQQQPVRRKVALKVLKPGMDTRQVVARFEAERQALALMDHPNIAHVFDGGSTDEGRPYFVMELVRGVSITEFCDQSCLPIRQRLELFVDVCQAVQHAHQKGIIHRDIKPTNVMVTLHDGQPVVKVIDFGIAKAMGQRLTEKTLFTNFAQMIGTPLYMSPEQAEMSGLDIDTRGDVYSLGVLMYELLTGTTPFENERLSQVGYDEMRRIIREEEPPKPSTRMSTVGKLATTASQKRQGDPRKLSKLFRGELDWIVMKALEKDRNRRYETASAFAADVERYLRDEPVQACPPSAWYRFRKFARRKKTALAMVTCVLLALSAVTGGGGWLMRDRLARQWESEEKAIEILQVAEPRLRQGQPGDAALASAVLRIEALIENDTLGGEVRRRADQFLGDVRMLDELDEIRLRPTDSKGEMWDWAGAEKAYAAAFARFGLDVLALTPEDAAIGVRESPIREALLRGIDAWLQLKPAQERTTTWLRAVADGGDDNAWRRAVREAAAANDTKKLQSLAAQPETLKQSSHALAQLGSMLDGAGLRETAESVLRQAQQRYPADFWINYNLGHLLVFDSPPRPDDAIGYFRAAVAARPRCPEARSILGIALISKGDAEGAIEAYRQALALDPAFVVGHNNLANALRHKGQLDEAILECREALRLKPDFPDAHSFLGHALYEKRQIEGSIEEFSKCLEMDPKNVEVWVCRGRAYREIHQYDKSIADYNEAIGLDAKNKLAWFERVRYHSDLGDNAKAIADASVAIELDPQWSPAWAARAHAQMALGQYDKVLADCNKAIELDDKYWWAWDVRGLTYHALHRDDEALADLNRAVELAPENPWSRSGRASLYIALEQYDKALADYSKVIELGSKNADVLNRVAWFIASCADAEFRELNKYKAVQVATEAVALAPTVGIYWNTLGVAHCRAGGWNEAIAALKKSMELRNGGDSFDWFFLAMAHWQLGDKELARKWYHAAALWMVEYAPGDVQLRRFRDEAAALLSVTANAPRRQLGDADLEIWTLVREAQPDSVAARHWRGNKYSRLALWDLGAAEFAEEFQCQAPASANLWFMHALLRVYVGDAEGYRKIAKQAPQHFQHESSNVLARALTLAPDPDVDLDWAVEQAELSVKNENGAWSHNALGLVHYRAGKYEQALEELQDALRRDGHWRYAILSHSVLAMAYHRLGRAAEARQALTEADRKVDQWQESLLGLSREPAGATWWDLLEGLVLYREAKIMLEGSPPPDDPRLVVARAHAFAALAEDDKAEEACRHAVELGTTNFGVRLACARIRVELHQYDKAVADFSKAIELDPKSAPAWNERGAAYANLHEYEEAIADYARAIELDQKNAFLWYCQALLRCGTSNRDGYRNDCATMLERFGKSEDRASADWLAWTCVLAPEAVPDPAQVVQVAEKAVTNDPNNQSCLNALGAALYRAGRFDEAAKRLSEANAATPNLVTSPVYPWLFLAMTHHRLGHADEARRWLDKAVQAIDQALEEPVNPDAEPSGKPQEIKAADPLTWNRALTFELLRREAQDLIMKSSTETGP